MHCVAVPSQLLGITVEPSKTIIATLMASLKPIKNWVVIGDWNVQIQDILSSNVAENCGGQFLATKEPTTDFGHHLDYCLSSRSVAGLIGLAVDVTIPVRPHLAIVATLQLDQAAVPVPQLAGFTKDLGNTIQDSTPCVGDWEFEMTPSSECFAQFSRQVGATTKRKGARQRVVQSDYPSTGGPCKIPPPMEWRGCSHLAPHLQAARTATNM